MNSFVIRLAELNILIESKYPYLPDLCKNYIVESNDVDISAVAIDEKIQNERTRSDEEVSPSIAESLCVYRDIAEQLPKYDRVLFHGAAISYNGKAYLFTAPSGTGKTTHVNLWRKFIGDDVGIINGDKPILLIDKTKTIVFGTPWAGKEGWQTNTSAELCGICFVTRGTDNTCVSISSSHCLIDLFNQIYMPADSESASKTYELIDRLVSNVPLYRLSCDISEDAVKASFEALTSEEYLK